MAIRGASGGSRRERRRPTRAFWVANAIVFLDSIVYFALLPRLPFYAHEFALSTPAVGLLYGVYPLLSAATAVPAGVLADRLGPRPVLAGGLGVFVVASVGFALATQAWELWGARALQGLGAGVTAPVAMAVIAASADTGRLGSTLGLAVSLQGLASVAGPILGGIAVPALGASVAFGVPAAIGALILCGIAADRSALGARRTLAAGTRVSRAAVRDRDVRAGAGILLAVGAVGAGVEVIGLLALRRAGLGSSELGTLLAGGATIGLVASLVVGHALDRRGVTALVRAWSAAMVVLVCAFALSTAVAWLVALLLVLWVAQIPAGGTLAYAQGSEGHTRGSGLGTGFGLSVMAWSLGAAAGPVLIGAVASATSDAAAYGLSVVLALVLVAPALLAGRARAARSADAGDRVPGAAPLAEHDACVP